MDVDTWKDPSNEIERLREENEQLRTDVKFLQSVVYCGPHYRDDINERIKKIRARLKPDGPT